MVMPYGKAFIEHQERDEWEQDQKLKNDPRVTKFGKFLRKTSLDEFPALKCLFAAMALVGPRPVSPPR